MELATPRALAALLRRDKEVLLAAWEAKVQRLPEVPGAPVAVLRDDIPRLIEALAEGLARTGSTAGPAQPASAAHGAQRQQIGAHLAVIVEEYRLLRSTILEHADAEGLLVAGDVNRAVNDALDEGVKTAIHTYIKQRDGTERRRREEYLRFVVHDLRSPLSAIYYAIVLAEKELEQLSVSERVRSIHTAVKRNIERMSGLIVKLLQEEENLRTAAHIEPVRETVELRQVVQTVAQTLRSLAASSDTAIVNDVAPDLVVRADIELLGRIFQNLITNAIEFTPKGRVVVGASAGQDGRVECWVSDNGRGMPLEIKRTVFEPYVSTDKERGAGLGLAIVKRLVEAHGGQIDVESREGDGTTVRFSLPAA